MRAIPWNDGWTVKHLDNIGEGKSVRLPHDAMLGEKKSPDALGGTNTGWYEGFDYLYEKNFEPGSEFENKKMILEFEGVYHNAEVWINDTKAAFRPYGYTNFYVDVSKLFKIGQNNNIRVIARNADQPNSRWYSGAGIYRPVTLWVGGDVYIPINGVKIRTLSINPAKIEIRVRTNTNTPVKIEIFEGIKKVCSSETYCEGETTEILEIAQAKLWDINSPYLYECRVTAKKDVVSEKFGIRSLTWGDNGVCINGERVIIQGACIHHDNGLLGAVCDPDAVERKVRLMQENGYNAIRSAHNPCSKALLDVCDRRGVLVMDEYIDHWYIHKTEYDYVDYFEEWWRQDLRDMVEKDYNHPSVIMYSTGNEVSETAQKRGIRLTGEMTKFLHHLDDTRPVTCGINIFFNFLSSIGFGVYSDKKAKKAVEKKGGKSKAVGSQFFNNLAGLLGDEFMKRGATFFGCDIKTRDAFANMDIAGYNYGIYRYIHDLKKYPDRLILGSETFCKDAYKFREMAKKNPRLVGDFVWAGMDYLGEVMVGSWEYSDYAANFNGGLGWVSAGSGRVDLTGKPLCEALYTRVAFECEKGPFIGVCPVNHTNDKHSPSAWKMSNALESWSFAGYEGKAANVEVYVRAYRVVLFINGEKIGEKILKNDCIAKFRCIYESGTIEAVSYDKEGKEIGRNSLRSASEKTQIIMEAEGKDVSFGHLSFIRIRYADNNKITKPLERGIIKLAVEGGTLEAFGNACPYNEMGYSSNQSDTYYGEALAIVRADDKDEIKIAASDGTYNSEIAIQVVKE